MKNSSSRFKVWRILVITMLSFFSLSRQDFYPPDLPILNPGLMEAYIALQAWKLAINSDPNGFTSNWNGPNVCNYTGVYCASAPYDPFHLTVAGIDLNHANIAGFLPEKLGLLKDLAIFHLNSNRFYGTIPNSFVHLKFLYELDISNNQFSGQFPYVVLWMPSLIFLDIRFNEFDGEIPPQLFELQFDALFINDNKFQSPLPENLGDSPVSVFVAANNKLGGCIPQSITRMGNTLEELILQNLELKGCIQQDIGMLKGLKVFDISSNNLAGPLPTSIRQMRCLEQLNVAHNKLSGPIPASICSLRRLESFIYSFNYFSAEPPVCLRLPRNDDRANCIPNRPQQRTPQECSAFYAHTVSCDAISCSSTQ